jgi:outer membrane protein assembly factor BamD
VAGAALLLGACASGGPQLNQLEPDALYQLAQRKLEQRSWGEAIRALDQFTARFPGDARTEEARFQLGRAYFEKKDYVTAAGELVRLASDYPSGRFADNARFTTCEAYYRLSPKPQLDQEYTRAAIEHCDALIVNFPQSEYTPKAEQLIGDLREKLAAKVFLSGEYYYKRKALDSSIIYYEGVLRDYPATSYAPKSLLRLVQIYQRLNYEEEMAAARDRLLHEYPDSPEAKQAQEIAPPSQG